MLDLLRCDSCAKPLGGGAVKRGDAIERHGLVICRSCLLMEERGHALPISPPAESKNKWQQAEADSQKEAVEAERLRLADEDTAPLLDPVTPHLKVMDAAGNLLDAEVERGRDGGLVIRLATSARPNLRAKITRQSSKILTETAPTAQVGWVGEVRLPKRGLGRAALSRRLDIENTRAKEGRSHNLFSAGLLLAVVLPLLGYAIYTAINSQSELNQILADNERLKGQANKTFVVPQVTAPPVLAGDEVSSTADQTAAPAATVVKPTTSYPLVLDPKLAEDLAAHEREIAAGILERLKDHALETRLLGLSQAIQQVAVECAPMIRPLLQSTHASERQLACEALGFLMVSDAREELEAIRNREDEEIEVRHAAGRALSRMDFVSRNNTLDGWTREELENLAQVLRKKGENANGLRIVERALATRKEHE